MALITCPECGKEISDKATVCIHCGYPISELTNNTETVSEEIKEDQQNDTIPLDDASLEREQGDTQHNEQDTNTINDNYAQDENTDIPVNQKKKSKKKIFIIVGAIAAVVIIVALFAVPSEFEKVQHEVVQIAGRVSSGTGYFRIDTYPDDFENMDELLVGLMAAETQEDALEGIKYANEALGFTGALYSKMLETTALMGRQTEENSKYRVSWTYHPDDGLEVTYEIK